MWFRPGLSVVDVCVGLSFAAAAAGPEHGRQHALCMSAVFRIAMADCVSEACLFCA